MSTATGTSKIKLGLTLLVFCSLVVAALIYAGKSAGPGHYYARAAQLPFYAGLYGVWLVVHGLWINFKQKDMVPVENLDTTISPAQEVPVIRSTVRKSNLRRGFSRLGLVLILFWWLVLAGAVLYEYIKRNIDCEFSSYELDCSMFFWSWVSQNYEPAQFSLNLKKVLLMATLPPVGCLLLALLIAWVVRGFRASDKP